MIGPLPQRVLLAGCGYVGATLGAELVRAGCRAIGLRRRPEALPSGIERFPADLLVPRSLEGLPDVDAVVYAVSAGARVEPAYRRAYVEGLRNLQAALAGRSVQRLVYVSSTGVYGQTDGAWVDEDSPTEPEGFSGRILLEGEALAQASPIPGVVLRLGGIYGPGRTRLLEQVRAGLTSIHGGPPKFTNRVHRDDCAGMLAHLLRLDQPARCYLGVDDEPAERDVVLRWMAGALGVPEPAVGGLPDGQEATSKRCSNRRLKESGYQLRYPTFREGYRSLLAG